MQQGPQRLVVQIPPVGKDGPVWTRVSVIAVLGFVIGIAWPKLAGFQLGPSPPDDERRPAAAAGSASSGAAEPDDSAPVAAASSSGGVAGKAPEPVAVQTVIVKGTDVLTCRDAKDKAVEKCDRPDFDSLLVARLQELARCPSAAGLSGKLSIGFDVDFKRNKIQVLRGKSTTIPRSTVTGIWECATKDVSGVPLDSVKHEYGRYTVFYAATFFPPGRVIDEASQDGALAVPEDTGGGKDEANEAILGTAQVVYDTVLVRDEPKTGNVVARLVRGTRVQLLSKKGSWYRIKFNDREGWVYRGSIAQ